MKYVIVGLGNPGDEYTHSRHNVGRFFVSKFAQKHGGEWKMDKKRNALVSEIEVEGQTVLVMLPETFMNNSGKSLVEFRGKKKQLEKMIVVYDDLDLPIGGMKISFNRSSGGHKGVESIIRSVGSEGFNRIRIGISPTTTKGVKKPKSDVVKTFVLADFGKKDEEELKKVSKKINTALETIISEGVVRAMNECN